MDDVTIIIQPIAPVNIAVSQVGTRGPAGPSGGTFTYVDAPDDVVMVSGNAYKADNPSESVVLNFPPDPTDGNICAINGFNTGGWTLDLREGETVQVTGTTNTISGPSHGIINDLQYDSATFVFLAPYWIGTLNGCNYF